MKEREIKSVEGIGKVGVFFSWFFLDFIKWYLSQTWKDGLDVDLW